MILYNFLLIVILILKKLKLKKNLIFKSLIFILILLVGLRSVEIGSDSITYEKVFNEVSFENINKIYMEKGYLLFNIIAKNIVHKTWLFFLMVAIITYYGIYKFILKNSLDSLYSLFFFISLKELGSTMNIMRQMLALSIILMSFEFLKNKKIGKFLLLSCIAITFHYSAIVFLLMFFLRKIKFKRKYFYAITVLTFVFLLCYKKIFMIVFKIPIFSRYEGYLKSEYFTGWNPMTIFLTIIYFVIMLSYYNFFIRKKEVNYLINLKMWICTLSFLFSAVGLVGSLLSRMGIYYSFFNIIIIPEILNQVKHKKIINILVIVLCISYHFIVMYFRPEWDNIYPYKFYWSN